MVRKDLKLSKGKLAAQVAHASFSSSQLASRTAVKAWERDGQKKVVLAAEMKQITELKKKCRKLRIPCSLISDAGLTEIPSGTVTCLGIGPADDSRIDKLTGSLPLLK